jgi:LuxR family maltose regulon positive regulatory protein
MNLTKLLISTKFAPPRIGAKHVPRKNLLETLERAQHCALALITGSAGYGKTTLLAQWRQACLKSGAEVAWLSLTPDDKSLADFCAAFFAAMRRLGVTPDLDMAFEGSSSASIEAAIAQIIGGAADLPKELFLILDDYHHVEDPWAHKLVQKLLDHCPSNLHIVIASRAAPPLSLSRLRVTDQIVEVDCADLPFDAVETRTFLDENLGSGKINADEQSLIQELTGGWPSCLQLIVMMLKNRPEARARLNDLVWRSSDLQTYLSEEIMAHLPIELAEFAEALSVFRRFNAALAEEVTGNPRAAELLKRMEVENLLIQPVASDDRLPWFRFHRLFGEFLSTRLERRGAAAVAALHSRASRWFARNDLLVEAVRHANFAGDVELAAAVIEGVAPATWSYAYLGPVLRLLDRVPQETLLQHRRLFFLACLTVSLTARPAVAESRLAQLETSDTARHPEVAFRLPLVHAVIALQRDDTQRTIDLLEASPDAAAGNPFLMYLVLAALSLAYAAAGRYADARKLLESHPIPLEDENNDMAILAQSAPVLCLLLEGEVRAAERIGSPLLARAVKAHGHRSACVNVCAAFLADAYYELDRIDDARETIANRLGLLESSGVEVTIRASLCRARLDLLQEGPAAAMAFLQQQTTRFRSLGLERAWAMMLAEQVHVELVKGDRTQAQKLSASLDELAQAHSSAQGLQAEIAAAAAMARARVLIGEQPDRALAALDQVRAHADAHGRRRMMVLVDLLSARALEDLERPDEAMGRRTRAVQEACRLGLIRTLVDEGPLAQREVSRLVQEKKLDGEDLRYAADLLERFPDDTAAKSGPAAARPAGNRRGQAVLTQREVEILDLVAQAMSNKRIALTLNITLETVKWNLRNIYAKLGVSSRYDAMVWARNQDLIR